MTMMQFDDTAARALEAAYTSGLAVARRQRALQLLTLRAGDAVLDVGTGPGYMAGEMAAAVGASGRVVGVDRSQQMLARARERCAPHAHADFAPADATELPFAAESFDAAAVVQVYEYVAEIEKALAELRRVLKPGGRAVVVDIDWDSLVWETRNRQRAAKIHSAWDEHLADPFLPRRLAPLMRQAGFAVTHVEAHPMVALAPEPFLHGLTQMIARFVPGRRGVTAEDAAAWLADLDAAHAAESYFFSVNAYLFAVRRQEA